MWSDGKLKLESLAGYSKEYFQLVKAVPSFMSPIIEQAPDSVVNELVYNQEEDSSHIKPWIKFAGSLGISEEELEKFKKKSVDYLEKVGEGLRKKGAIVKCKVATGSAAEEIIKAEDEFKADLVAMSTHGRSGLSRWAFGSVTDRVLRGGAVPVLVVRARE